MPPEPPRPADQPTEPPAREPPDDAPARPHHLHLVVDWLQRQHRTRRARHSIRTRL